MTRLTVLVRWCLTCALVSTAGCSNALIFATSTLTAIDLNAVENGQQTVTVGYKRFEGVVMPVRKDKDGPARQHAFSVLAASSYDTGGLQLTNLTGTKVKTVFATGEAAAQTNAPKAVASLFAAFSGDLFSPEAAFLLGETNDTLRSLSAPRDTQAINAVWREYFASGAPNAQDYAIWLIQRGSETGDPAVMLAEAKSVLAGGATVELTEAEKAAPRDELIRLIDDQTSAADTNLVLDSVGSHLSGPDQISTAAPIEMVIALLSVSARQDDRQTLRSALSQVNGVARS